MPWLLLLLEYLEVSHTAYVCDFNWVFAAAQSIYFAFLVYSLNSNLGYSASRMVTTQFFKSADTINYLLRGKRATDCPLTK